MSVCKNTTPSAIPTLTREWVNRFLTLWRPLTTVAIWVQL